MKENRLLRKENLKNQEILGALLEYMKIKNTQDIDRNKSMINGNNSGL